MSTEKMNVNDIKVGERYRKELGDLETLCESMTELELLHPIVVTDDGRLIAGYRRLEAAKKLGWETISVNKVKLNDILRGELDENAMRKNFTPSSES